jgi:EmrB/QacA subfamily drug resistance transporter
VTVLRGEPAELGDPAVRPSTGGERLVLVATAMAAFMAFLDVTIVNVVLPAIHRAFSGTTLPDLSWVLNGYNVALAALLVPLGRLADLVGRSRMFLIGLVLFLVGSVLCGLALSAWTLVGARVLQATGGAILIPTSLGLTVEHFPAERMAGAMSVWAAAGALAAAVGPSLGGVLVQSVGWRSAFFVNVVMASAILPAVPTLLRSGRSAPNETNEPLPDLVGAGLLAIGIGALAFGVVKAPDWGWGSPRVFTAWAVSVALLAGLVLRSRHHRAPLISNSLLRIGSFRTTSVVLFVWSTGFYALLLANIVFLNEVWHYSVLRAGFAVSPAPLVAVLAAVISGPLIKRFGPRPVVAPSLLVFAAAPLLYRRVGVTPNYVGAWLPVQLLSGTSMGFAVVGLTAQSTMDLPARLLATGSAVTTCFRQIGAVVGIACLVAVLGAHGVHNPLNPFRQAWLLIAGTAVVAAVIAAFTRSESAVAARPRSVVTATEAPVGGWEARIPGAVRRVATVQGNQVVYRVAGDGPHILLIHGLVDNSSTWRKVVPALAESHTVIVPDLYGHGETTGPRDADYSPSGHAGLMRDLLDVLGVDEVTAVGHSLGASVALTFAYNHPERVRRLAVMSPGGCGPEAHIGLRALALPGIGGVLGAVTSRPVRGTLGVLRAVSAGAHLCSVAKRLGRMRASLERLSDGGHRHALIHSVRAVIDVHGQRVSALSRVSLIRKCPILVLWGLKDTILPASHADALQAARPDAQLVLLEETGHHMQFTHAEFVAGRLADFARERECQSVELRVSAGNRTSSNAEPSLAR